MMKPRIPERFAKDDIIVFTRGDYSDYEILFVAKALQDFATDEVAATIPTREDSLGRKYKKVALHVWLCTKGYIEEIDHKEWWEPDAP